jgi:hypothetical protein
MYSTYGHIIPRCQGSNCVWSRRRSVNYTGELHFALFRALQLPNTRSVALHCPLCGVASSATIQYDNVWSHKTLDRVSFVAARVTFRPTSQHVFCFTYSAISVYRFNSRYVQASRKLGTEVRNCYRSRNEGVDHEVR